MEVDDVILFDVDGTLVEGLTLVDDFTSGLQALLHKSSVKNLNFTHNRQTESAALVRSKVHVARKHSTQFNSKCTINAGV